MRRFKVTVTTASDGSATAYSPRLAGKVHSIRYVKTDFADGSTMTITAEATGEAIWSESNVNASASRYPRAATHGVTGTASLYASGGTAVQAPVALGNDRIKIVIASGGNTKTGNFHFCID